MPLIADRFLAGEAGDDVVDLATGEAVRLDLERAPADVRSRAALCDRLAGLRHPLLLPLVDYGMCGGHWFEAHARLPPLQASAAQKRDLALHLVRFLRAAGVELTAGAAARNVRPAIEARAPGWRPVGVFLQPRPPLEAIRTVIESAGPPGVTAIAIDAPTRSGLRTARLQIARAARLAGYHVVDSRFGTLEHALSPPRHLCVLDWMPPSRALPSVLSLAAAGSARRHGWIRFCRQPAPGPGAIGLEPLMTRELIASIFVDADLGPSAAEVAYAARGSGGLPGILVETLSVPGRWRGGAMWVHETAPEYGVVAPRAPQALTPSVARAGVARLMRAVDAARAMVPRGRHGRAARVLSRCAAGLAARGASAAAADAACSLGDLLIDRARPRQAMRAYEDAARWDPQGVAGLRALVGRGRALMEQGRLHDAEAALRTAILADEGTALTRAARVALAELLCARGRVDAAEEIVGGTSSACLADVRRLKGDLAGAARAAGAAVREADSEDPRSVCEAHLAAARVEAALGHADRVSSHLREAERAAAQARLPVLRLRAAAEAYACGRQTGAVLDAAARERLLRAAARLPPLAAAQVRAALGAGVAADAAFIAHPRDNSDLIHRFQAILAAVHEAPDEIAALQLVAADLLASLDACSLVIRSAAPARRVAAAGRSWPEDAALAQPVLDGGGAVFRHGITPEAVEPVRAGGAVIGAIAVRWVTGAEPPDARARDLLKVAAAAAAPMLKTLAAAPAPADPGGASYPDDLLGRGPSPDRGREAIRRAAQAPDPVLIEGESGSGKELVARAIHARGPRRGRRFCAVNCAAITDDLLEAELFGHVRGAFTGAVAERPGVFEEADQGTILLDEAGELTPRAQAKLLRVLQEGEVRRVGENMPRKVDARVIAATNRSLEADVRSGRFRADLRFRLDVIRIRVPPLRERADEVPWLARRIWGEAAARVGTRATLGDDLIAALARYDWPGNVRELQNVIASLAVHGPRRGRMPASLLPAHIARAAAEGLPAFGQARLEFERRYVRAALAHAGGSRRAAAAQLGVSRQGLAKIMKRLDISA